MFIIACPSCQTKYKLKPEMVGTGKNMTCAKCKHKWFFAPPKAEIAPYPPQAQNEAPAEPQEAQAPSPEEIQQAIAKIAAEQTASPPQPQIEHDTERTAISAPPAGAHPHRSALLRAGALYIVLVAVAAGSGIYNRQAIVEAWPPSARIYDVIGMPIPVLGQGLNIYDLSWDAVREEKIDDNTGEKIVMPVDKIAVMGFIANKTAEPLNVPMLSAKLIDTTNQILHATDFHADGEKILPGEAIPFKAVLPLPRKVDFKIMVTFTEQTQTAHANPAESMPNKENPPAEHPTE